MIAPNQHQTVMIPHLSKKEEKTNKCS